jgi:hypothetical protein
MTADRTSDLTLFDVMQLTSDGLFAAVCCLLFATYLDSDFDKGKASHILTSCK